MSSPRATLRDGSLWGICLGHSFTHWYHGAFYLLLPYMMLELGFSVAQTGALVSGMFIAKSLAGLPIGALTDLTRRKNLILFASLLLASLPPVLMSLADAYWAILALAMLMGLGNEMWHPASFSLLSARYPGRRGMAFGLHAMAASLGDLLAPLIIGGLLVVASWRDVLRWNLLPGLVIALAILFLLRNLSTASQLGSAPPATGASRRVPLAEYRLGFFRLLRNRTVLLLSLAGGVRAMGQVGLMTFLPIYLALDLGLSPLLVGLYLGVMQAGGLLAGPLVGALSDRAGRRIVVIGAMSATSLLVVALLLVQLGWLLVITVATLGFFLYSLRPVMQAWAMEASAAGMAGTVTSILFASQALLSSASPLVGGLLAERYGVGAAFYFVAAVIMFGNVIVSFVPVVAGELRATAAESG